jgi:hypothetical protein
MAIGLERNFVPSRVRYIFEDLGVVLHGAKAVERIQSYAKRFHIVPEKGPLAVQIPLLWKRYLEARGSTRARVLVIRDRRGHKGMRPKKWWVERQEGEVPEATTVGRVVRNEPAAPHPPPQVFDPQQILATQAALYGNTIFGNRAGVVMQNPAGQLPNIRYYGENVQWEP